MIADLAPRTGVDLPDVPAAARRLLADLPTLGLVVPVLLGYDRNYLNCHRIAEGSALRPNLLRSLILAIMMLATLAPVSSAAPIRHDVNVSAEVTIEAASLDCDFRGEPGCLNLVTRVEWNDATQAGTFCVDIGDFSVVHPVVAHGCATLTARSVAMDAEQSVVVSSTVVPAVYTDDCYRTDPEEQCVPRRIDLQASLTASLSGPSTHTKTQTRTETGGCRTVVRHRALVGDADVVLTVQGVVYRLPNPTADPHTASSTVTFSSTRTTRHC
ncbi:MAG: hypothetical protein H0U52_16990 [Chloroflexi bacterium]|nr:hypothetical protein [Chloroflexota bacterium]